jgi:hypothetical protein
MSEQRPRFRRGAKAINDFYNEYASEPIDLKQTYKLVARGTIDVGRDGNTLLGEESVMLRSLQRAAITMKPKSKCDT